VGIIHRTISTHIVSRAGLSNKQAKIDAVSYIQRFGSALSLNIHFHMLLLRGSINESPWVGNTYARWCKNLQYHESEQSDLSLLKHLIQNRTVPTAKS
jgi:hypothetical protein